MLLSFVKILFGLPPGVYVLLVFALLYALIVIDEKREQAKEKRLGYRIELLSAGQVRSADDEWALTYTERGRTLWFSGKHRKNEWRTLDIPSAANWETIVPEWARGRREEIVRRIKADQKQFHTIIREI